MNADDRTQTSAEGVSPAPVRAVQFEPGQMVAQRYRIVSLLGRGGMGEVYRADDLTLGQSVALKFLPEAVSRHPDAVQRFRNEVRVARQVSHPNVCRVHDVGEVDGRMFLSMEYVDGEDLASLLRRIGRLPEDKALEIARKLCAGLAAAHDKGVLHRDLKPHNVMLDARGQVLLTDFGLAALAGEVAGSEVRSGTPAYMAPEQLAGKEVSVRSDLYSLGLVLYELFTGKRPFEGSSLQDLLRARMETTPASLSSTVRDLDPAVERVILRCLQPDPGKRPASAISVSAALPGGDPLAAALAAGETPSPQMVAAAGEGAGLSMRVALPLYLWVLAGIVATGALYLRHSGLERIPGKLSTPVLENKAREIARAAGYAEAPEDTASGWMWASNYLSWVSENEKPADWDRVMRGRPPALRFWYREHIDWMVAEEFHDDLLTPGMLTMDDPSPVLASMVSMQLDPSGRLLDFRAMPPSKIEGSPEGAVDWGPLFRAAEVDPSQITAATPERLYLEAGDTRVAWTGKWPGSERPLRIEGVALGGKPVVFSLLGPWSPVERAASRPAPTTLYDLPYIVLGLIALVVVVATSLLVPRNLRRGRADVRGAMRLGVFLFCVHMALWVTRTHFTWSAGLMGMFFIAFCTSVFYGVLVCGVYLALEPFVRRHWPQTMIGWTRALAGQVRDPRVGRDVLIGAAVSILWRSSEFVSRAAGGQNWWPDLVSPEQFHTVRAALGEALEGVPHGVRDSLMFLFFIVLMRVVLRNQWLAGGSFVALFTFLAWGKGAGVEAVIETAVVYGTYAFVLLRFGLLAVASMVTFDSIVADMPFTTDVGSWYFPISLLMFVILFAIATWGFRQATRGQKLFREEWI